MKCVGELFKNGTCPRNQRGLVLGAVTLFLSACVTAGPAPVAAAPAPTCSSPFFSACAKPPSQSIQTSTAIPPVPAGGLLATNFDGRMDYLAESLRTLASTGPSAYPDVVAKAITPTFLAMKEQDGGYVAAGIYALLMDGPGRPENRLPKATWENDALSVALQDSKLTGAISKRSFPAIPMFDSRHGDAAVNVLNNITSTLILEAHRGGLVACETLVNFQEHDGLYHGMLPFERGKCANVAGTPQVFRDEAETQNEIRARASQVFAEQQQAAQAAARRCEAVGVAAPVFQNANRGADFDRVVSVGTLSPLLLKANRDEYLRRAAFAEAAGHELAHLQRGNAITPVLAPFTYEYMAHQLCGS